MIISCQRCGFRFKTRNKKAKYCTQQCWWKSNRGKPTWNKGLKTGLIPKTAFKKGINLKKENHPMWGKKHSLEHRRRIAESMMGKKSHLWKGGLTSENARLRNSLDYRIWREAVFARANWTCVLCFQVGGKLHADHIKPFSLYPELRLTIDNGRTLCVVCHKKTETYLVGVRWMQNAKRE